jgi:hypothetical protein
VIDLFTGDDIDNLRQYVKQQGSPYLHEMDKIVSPSLLYSNEDEGGEDKATVRGSIVREIIFPLRDGKSIDIPVKNILSKHYYPPGTYGRIIRDFYDFTEGFRDITSDLLRSTISPLSLKGEYRIWPQYSFRSQFGLYDKEIHLEFVEYLVKEDIITMGQANTTYGIFREGIDEEEAGSRNRLRLFPFIIAKYLKERHQLTYSYLRHTVKSFLDALKKDDGYNQLNLEMVVRNFRTAIDSDMLTYCIFVDYVFKGNKFLKNIMPPHRKARDTENKLLVYLVECFAKGGNKNRTFKMPEKFRPENHPIIFKRRREDLPLDTLKDIDPEQIEEIYLEDKYPIPITPYKLAALYIYFLSGNEIGNPEQRYKDCRKKYRDKLPDPKDAQDIDGPYVIFNTGIEIHFDLLKNNKYF